MKKRKLVILLAGAILIAQAGYLRPVNITGEEVIAEASETQDENIISDGTFSYVLNEDGTAKILGYTNSTSDSGKGLDVKLPSQVEKDGKVYKVTVIGKDYSYGFGFPNSIIIPEGVTEIEDNVFSGAGLKGVTLPDSLKKIGTMAFNFCKIRNLKLPKGLEHIGREAFQWNPLDYVELQSTPEIGIDAFNAPRQECRNGTFKIDAGIKNLDFSQLFTFKHINIDDDAEYYSKIDGIIYNKDLTEAEHSDINIEGSIKIPESVTKINGSCFRVRNISSITFSENLKYIGDDAFEECQSLTEISIPDSVNYVGKCAFYFCKNLKDVYMGNGIKSIERSCFAQCWNLKNFTIPEGVTEIKENAFDGCEDLETLILPKSLETIGDDAFYRWGLKNIIFKNGAAPRLEVDKIIYSDYCSRVILNSTETSEVQYVRKGCNVLYDADKYVLYENGQEVTDSVINEDKTFELKAR